MVYIETLDSLLKASKFPCEEIFMPTVGEQQLFVCGPGIRMPLAATVKLWMMPLLEAIKRAPSGVTASETPWQLSSVSPLGNGDPGAAVNAPLVESIWKALIVWSPLLETNRRLFAALVTILSSPWQVVVDPAPPVG